MNLEVVDSAIDAPLPTTTKAKAESSLRIAQLIDRILAGNHALHWMGTEGAPPPHRLTLHEIEIKSKQASKLTQMGMWRRVVDDSIATLKRASFLISTDAQPSEKVKPDEEFKKAFIESYTEAFADELDEMRTQGLDAKGIALLAECIEAGAEVFPKDEKEEWLVERKKRRKGLTPIV